MEELRAHVRKYGPVMQRYYVQYLSGFDAVVLNELVQVWQDCGFGFSEADFKGFFLSRMTLWNTVWFVDFDEHYGIWRINLCLILELRVVPWLL